MKEEPNKPSFSGKTKTSDNNDSKFEKSNIKQVVEKVKQFGQKYRADRLAKKEARVADMKDRLKRMKIANKNQIKLQRAIAKALNSKKQKEQLMTSGEYRAMYGRENTVNDGNILHTANVFNNFQKQNTGRILAAQNLTLQTKPINHGKMKWL